MGTLGLLLAAALIGFGVLPHLLWRLRLRRLKRTLEGSVLPQLR